MEVHAYGRHLLFHACTAATHLHYAHPQLAFTHTPTVIIHILQAHSYQHSHHTSSHPHLTHPQGSRLAALYDALAANRALSRHLKEVVLPRIDRQLDKNWAHSQAVQTVPVLKRGHKDQQEGECRSVFMFSAGCACALSGHLKEVVLPRIDTAGQELGTLSSSADCAGAEEGVQGSRG